MTIDRPLILNLAPTGAVANHRKNPRVPIAPDDIVADVLAGARLGIAMAHLHVRNADGTPSCDPSLFAQVIEALRGHPDAHGLVVCASTSGRHGQTLEERTAVLDLPADVRPDLASLTLGSVDFITGSSVNTYDTVRRLVDRMGERGVKPELEVFDLGMIELAKVLIGEGRLAPPCYFNLFLGNPGGPQPNAQHLGFLLGNLPEGSIASIGGIGKHQAQACALGAVCADGARIGLEDNLWLDRERGIPASNESLTRRMVGICAALERPLADFAWTRARLGLPSPGGQPEARRGAAAP
jgi:uncharacterized protein (DUF849 family)